jgi:hypothetical protein
VQDRLDQQADVTLAGAGDGLAEADGCLISEVGREAEHSRFPPELGSPRASGSLIAAFQPVLAGLVPGSLMLVPM